MIDKRVVKIKQKLYGIVHLCLVGNEGMIHNNYQFIQVTTFVPFVPFCVESNPCFLVTSLWTFDTGFSLVGFLLDDAHVLKCENLW